IPAGLEVVARDEIARDGLDPFGLDPGGTARIEPRRLDELGRENPFRRLLREPGARVDEEAYPARTEIPVAVAVKAPHGAEQACDQARVDRLVCARVEHHTKLRLPREALFGDFGCELRMDVAPF